MPSQFFDESGRPISPVSQQKGSVFGAPEPPRWEIQRRTWPAAPKVVHVVLSLNVGGLERLLVELVREGLRRGQRPVVVCLEEPGKLAEQVEALGVEVHCVYKQPGIQPRVVGKLAKLFHEIQPDVIHTHQVGALFYAGAAARRWVKAEERRRKVEGRRQKAENATLPHPNPLPEGEGKNRPHPSPLPEGEGIRSPNPQSPIPNPQPQGLPAVIHTEHGKHYAQRRRTRWLGKWAGRYADKFCCVSLDIAEEVRQLRVVPGAKIEVVPNGVDVAKFTRDQSAHSDFKRR